MPKKPNATWYAVVDIRSGEPIIITESTGHAAMALNPGTTFASAKTKREAETKARQDATYMRTIFQEYQTDDNNADA